MVETTTLSDGRIIQTAIHVPETGETVWHYLWPESGETMIITEADMCLDLSGFDLGEYQSPRSTVGATDDSISRA